MSKKRVVGFGFLLGLVSFIAYIVGWLNCRKEVEEYLQEIEEQDNYVGETVEEYLSAKYKGYKREPEDADYSIGNMQLAIQLVDGRAMLLDGTPLEDYVLAKVREIEEQLNSGQL